MLAPPCAGVCRPSWWELNPFYPRHQTNADPFSLASVLSGWCPSTPVGLTLAHPQRVAKARKEASLEQAHRGKGKANRAAAKRFEDWAKEAPAAGLKRQHLFSRNVTGWIPDKCDQQLKVELSELESKLLLRSDHHPASF